MTKRQLWESRAEYQAFLYANEVQQKALAAPYWQYKRNKNRREQQRLETDEMRKNGLFGVEMEEMTDMFKQASISSKCL
jgi:hypothetical protein